MKFPLAATKTQGGRGRSQINKHEKNEVTEAKTVFFKNVSCVLISASS